MIYANRVADLLIYDRPDKELRGYRVYTPGSGSIDKFKEMLDKLIYYKYNTIVMEVGGAMEYERHPKINETWEKFCKELSVSPDAADKIQFANWWAKNCIHVENGDGSYISKAEMRELVEYYKKLEFDIIPEVPSMSHSDYIVMAYPEINERAYDKYPDTYCPSNPKSYEILFDIIDEVVEVFEPEYMNIGHDELYTVGICDKCKGKDPVDLYVNDIIKINNYLKEKNIRSMMWCEKLLYKTECYNGVWSMEGAWARPWYGIPDMGRAAEKLPKDVILINWYWILKSFAPNGKILDLGYEDEKKLIDDGFEMLYGNFDSMRLTNYRKRIAQVKGALVSNWGNFEEEYMQRNRQNFSLASTAYTLWSHNYDNSCEAVLLEKVKEDLRMFYESSLGADIIKVRHTTDFSKEAASFWDGVFIIPEEWIIGNYIVNYTDGTKVKLPVNFYYNIGCRSYGINEKKLHKIFGACTPVNYKGETWYETAYKNPYPEKEIFHIYYEPEMQAGLDYEMLD